MIFLLLLLFFSLLAFLTIHLLFLLFPRSIQVLPFPPFLKVWIVFISRSLVFFFLFFFLLLFLLKSESRQKIHSGVAYEFKNNSFPLEYVLGF